MPISSLDGCDEQHWSEVKCILFDAITESGLDPSLVSDADDVGVIQARIVKNLYENPIVVCDVSGRNANVMFELGLRLAFDRPTVIVIDDKTPFSFDTSPIEHLRYPRDLRYAKIEKFKRDLSDKLSSVLKKAKEPDYSTFLKHFGSFTASKIDQKELAPTEIVNFITQKLTGIEDALVVIRNNMRMAERNQNGSSIFSVAARLNNKSLEDEPDGTLASVRSNLRIGIEKLTKEDSESLYRSRNLYNLKK